MAGSRIKGITIEIGGNTTKLEQALSKVNTSLKTTQSKLNDVNRLLKVDPTNTTLLAQKHQYLSEKIGETNEKLKTLRDAQKAMDASGVDKNSAQYQALQREIIATEQQLKKLESTTGSSSATLEAFGIRAEKLGQSLNTVAEKTKVLSAAATGVLIGSAKTAADFEYSLSKVEALSGATAKEMQMLEEKAREMGASTRFSASESAEAFQYMALAGWNVDTMLNSIAPILNLAAAADMDLARASDIVTDYMTAFGLSADQAGAFVDEMAYAMANSNTNVEQLGEAYKNVAATANSLGYSVEETTAVIMTMADAGIKGGEAGTALNAIMTRLATDTKGAASELKDYGVEIYDTEGNMQSLSSILEGTRKVWSDLTDEEQANLAKTIAGTSHYSALQVVMNGLSDDAKSSGKSFSDYAKNLDNASGSADKMAKVMQSNLKGELTILKSQVEGIAIDMGKELLPVLKDGVDILQKMADGFGSLTDEQKKTIVKVIALTAAISPMAKTAGNVATAVGKVSKALSTVQTVSMLANPVVLALAATLGAVASVVILDKQFADPITKAANAAGEAQKQFDAEGAAISNTSAEVAIMRDRLDELMSKTSLSNEESLEMASIVDRLNGALPDLNWSFDNVTGRISDSTGAIVENTKALQDNIDKALLSYQIEANQERLKELVAQYAANKQALAEANAAVAETEERIANATDLDYINTLNDQLTAEKNNRRDLTEAVAQNEADYQALTTSIADASAQLDELNTAGTGTNFVEGFNKGIKDHAFEAIESIGNLGEDSLDELNARLEVHSPSRKTMETGKNVSLGLARGITANKALVKTAVDQLAAAANLSNYRATLINQAYDTGVAISSALARGITAGQAAAIAAAASMSAQASAASQSRVTTNNNNVSMTINAAPNQDVKAIADQVGKIINQQTSARKAYR